FAGARRPARHHRPGGGRALECWRRRAGPPHAAYGSHTPDPRAPQPRVRHAHRRRCALWRTRATGAGAEHRAGAGTTGPSRERAWFRAPGAGRSAPLRESTPRRSGARLGALAQRDLILAQLERSARRAREPAHWRANVPVALPLPLAGPRLAEHRPALSD